MKKTPYKSQKSKPAKNASAKDKKTPVHRPLQMGGKQESIIDLEDVTPIIEFLENFRLMADPRAQHPSKLISLKVPEPLLAAFKFKAQHAGIPYQTMIKRLMLAWLKER